MIDIETAIQVLKEQNCGPPFICPKCRDAPLTISQNGTGPTFTCGAGCCESRTIAAQLEAIAGIAHPRGPNVNLLACIRRDLALPELVKIIKHGRLGSSYNFHLDDGRIIVIGSIAILAVQPKFRTAFLPQVRRNPPRHKPLDWDKLVEQIEQAAEERDAVATLAEETMSWIAGAIHEGRVKRGVNVENAEMMFEILAPGVNGRPPFFDTEGRLHLRLEHVIQWLGRIASIRITQPELSARLSEIDFERTQHQARHGGELRKARYWTSAPAFEDRT